MIHVCYALRDESGRYSKFVGTSMKSLLENTRAEVTIHLLHDSTLSQENRDKFLKITPNLIFYNLDELAPDLIRDAEIKLPDTKNFRGTIASMYRLLIPDILSEKIERVIYLDADTIVNLDISELWQIDLNNFPIAATPHFFSYPNLNAIISTLKIDSSKIDPHDYFNAGVLLLDLNKLRLNFDGKGQLFRRSIEILLQNPRNISLDQDALNVLFQDNFLKLPARFNRFASWLYRDSNEKTKDELYHYLGKSLKLDFRYQHNRLWFEYFLKTPFLGVGSFKNIHESYNDILINCQNVINLQKDLFQKILKASLNRRRVFLICPKDESTFFEAFGRREDDVIIDATKDESLSITFKLAEKFRDVVVLFICINSKIYPEIRERLLTLGLNENENFFNGLDLIQSKVIGYGTNQIIGAM